jgi:hypothetical protein
MSNKNIYLVAYYAMKPRAGVKTNVKGWMDNPDNLQYDERVEIVRGLKSNTNTAKIVLDFSTKTVIRNNFNQDKDFKKLFKYFFGGYHKYMTTVMMQLDTEWMDTVVAELEQEVKEIEDAAAAAEIENAQAVLAE